MSVVLKTEKKSELPLIAFTTCVPAAEGIALCDLLVDGGLVPALAALMLASLGMVASIAHLAKPSRAPRALTNWRTSWLSREIAIVGAFWGCLLVWTAGRFIDVFALDVAAQVASCLVGVVLIYVIARAYQVSTRPAWCGPEGLFELWATACGVGSCFALLFANNMFTAVTLVSVSMIGLGIDLWSHPARKARLTTLIDQPDERVSLTLEHYEKLWPTVHRLYLLEGCCCLLVVLLAVLRVSSVIAVAITAATFLGQLLVHGAHRHLFYELPVQVRWIRKLRK